MLSSILIYLPNSSSQWLVRCARFVSLDGMASLTVKGQAFLDRHQIACPFRKQVFQTGAERYFYDANKIHSLARRVCTDSQNPKRTGKLVEIAKTPKGQAS